jgi:heme-degrading monooxygenase HmoA
MTAQAQIIEMDRTVTLAEQLANAADPVMLINTFTVDPEDVEQFLAAWADDAAYFKRQPGFISTQLHRGVAGSCVFLNDAVWESTEHFRQAVTNLDFRA